MTTFSYSTELPAAVKVPLLIVPMYEGPKPGPGARETGSAGAYSDAKLTGKIGENLLVTKRRGDRFAAGAVLLVGVGPKEEFSVNGARASMGRLSATARRFGTVASTFALAFPPRRAAEAAGAVAEGLGLGAYRFDRYRSKEAKAEGGLKRVMVLGSEKADGAGCPRGREGSRHHGGCRELGTRSGEHSRWGPGAGRPLAKRAQAMAEEVGLTCKVWTDTQLTTGGFGGILGVGKGSDPPATQ